MASMNAVEVADGDNGAPGFLGDFTRPVNRDHLRRSPLHEVQVALDQSDCPSSVPGCGSGIIASSEAGGQSCESRRVSRSNCTRVAASAA